ncbi:MAG: hypothetical protein HY743_00860 [Deltaproteobacteria bacterium]|nr:hypothetical protein [Deltaproteobacteria bacterium]
MEERACGRCDFFHPKPDEVFETDGEWQSMWIPSKIVELDFLSSIMLLISPKGGDSGCIGQ